MVVDIENLQYVQY